MIKKFISFFAAVSILTAVTVYAAEPKETVLIKDAFSVRVDGSYIQNSAHYDYETGIVYLPLRAVFETLGAEVLWNGESRTVEIISGGEKKDKYIGEYKEAAGEYLSTLVYPNSVILNIDGKAVSADTFVLEDRTYISIETLEPVTGHVYADSATMTVRVYSKDYKTLDENTAVIYGDEKTLNYTQFFDLAKFMYGDFSTAKEQGFGAIDNYLLFNKAVEKISDELNFTVTDDEATAFIEENNVNDMIESRQIEDKEFFNSVIIKDYVLRDKIAGSDTKDLYNPTDEELESWYSTLAESKGVWLQAQHILISKDESGEGLKKAESLLREAKKEGTDFTALMLENSEDPGSQSTPEGYIFKEGQMVESFYKGALNLKVGEISEIVESEYGYHIIKKIAHWENGIPLENIKDEVKASYNDKLFGEKLYNYAAENDVFYLKDNIISKYNESIEKE